jgi:hypothetical protein
MEDANSEVLRAAGESPRKVRSLSGSAVRRAERLRTREKFRRVIAEPIRSSSNRRERSEGVHGKLREASPYSVESADAEILRLLSG